MALPPDRPLIVIAAGGDGRRIGGAKPARMLGGRRLIGHAADWATRHGEAMIAVRPGDGDWGSGLPLLADVHAGIGPISALASGMAHAAARGRRQMMLIGCDMPFLPGDLVARLAAAIGDAGAAMPESGGFLHPLATLWRVDAAAVEAYIAAGGQSVRRFAETLGLVRVTWDAPGPCAPDPFGNVNDAAALAAAEARIRAQAR
jgi:molybdenum cofactor guanylyltransferase